MAIKRLRPALVKHNPWLHEAMVNEALIGGLYPDGPEAIPPLPDTAVLHLAPAKSSGARR